MGAKIQAFDIFQTPLSSHYPLPLRKLTHPSSLLAMNAQRTWTSGRLITHQQSCGSGFIHENPEPDTGQGFWILMNQNWTQKIQIWSKIAIYLCLSYRRSLQSSKVNIQHYKTMKFTNFFLFVSHFCPPGSGSGLRIRVRIQGPHWIRIQSGSGSTALLTREKCKSE